MTGRVPLPFDPNARDAVTMRAERVRIIARQFQTYAGLMRRFSTLGGDVASMRQFAAQAADCLDSAKEELFAVINDATINPPAPPPVQPKE